MKAMGFPPVESAEESRNQFGSVNFFGGNSKTSLKLSKKLEQLEKSDPNATFVILSDFWVDDATVRPFCCVIVSVYLLFDT